MVTVIVMVIIVVNVIVIVIVICRSIPAASILPGKPQAFDTR